MKKKSKKKLPTPKTTDKTYEQKLAEYEKIDPEFVKYLRGKK